MLIKVCCIIIFITYCILCALLTYYFIKRRLIWDSLFSLESIYNSIRELILCPEHFLIWIPFIEFENTECSNKRKINNDARIEIKKVLEHITNIMKDIITIKHKNNSNLEKIKWVLEGTMKDYDRMYEENVEFYNNLTNSYEILNDKFKKNKDNDNNENKKDNSLLTLEELVILENNIELCDNIYNVLSIFSDEEYKLLNQIESRFMTSLLYDLIENIRIYKIISLMEIDK